jgi:hypothetical protein
MFPLYGAIVLMIDHSLRHDEFSDHGIAADGSLNSCFRWTECNVSGIVVEVKAPMHG